MPDTPIAFVRETDSLLPHSPAQTDTYNKIGIHLSIAFESELDTRLDNLKNGLENEDIVKNSRLSKNHREAFRSSMPSYWWSHDRRALLALQRTTRIHRLALLDHLPDTTLIC